MSPMYVSTTQGLIYSQAVKESVYCNITGEGGTKVPQQKLEPFTIKESNYKLQGKRLKSQYMKTPLHD